MPKEQKNGPLEVEAELTWDEIADNVGKWFLDSKTIWLNGLVLIIALAGFVAGPDFPLNISEEGLRVILFVQAIANLVLRFVTQEPLRFER